MIEFENLWAFLIPFIYLIFLKFCKQKKEAFYFSNIKMLKNATKNRTILKGILKFLLIYLVWKWRHIHYRKYHLRYRLHLDFQY